MTDWDRKNEIDNAVNQLSMQLTHEKMQDRKHLLRIEIAKATDRRVKAELQSMLADLERKERRYHIAMIVATIIVVAIGGIFAFSIMRGDPTKNTSVIASNSETNASTSMLDSNSISSESIEQSDTATTISTSSQQSVKSDVVDTKNLTSDQLKQWISAVLNAEGVTKNFAVDVETGDDGYAHGVANFTDVQTDPIGNFRVNSNGQLEEAGLYYGKPGEWIVVSPSFMDTTHIPAKESADSVIIAIAKGWMKLRNNRMEDQLEVENISQGTPVVEGAAAVYPENVYQVFGEQSGATNEVVFSIHGDNITSYPVNMYLWADKPNLSAQDISDIANRIISETTQFSISDVDEATAKDLSTKIVFH